MAPFSITSFMTKFPLGEKIEKLIDGFKYYFSGMTKALSHQIQDVVDRVAEGLMFFHPLVLIGALVIIAWLVTRRIGVVAFTLLGMLLIWNLEMWEPTVQTLALVIFATLIAIAIGVPLGILAAINRIAHHIIMPILDFMQTLPAFVYLIPAVPFFGLGTTAAIFSTVIFAMPPAIRLTDLGIRQVPKELVEAADAFGSTTKQKLFKLQLPVAMTSIRAGVNQTIMLSLSMVVIAAMIGCNGLGKVVWTAINRNKIGDGFEGGICIVVIAIILDRIMQGAKSKHESDA